MQMLRKNKISIKPRYFLVIMVTVCIVLLLMSFKFADKFEKSQRIVADVMTPMQIGINRVGSFFTSKLDYFRDMDALIKENEELVEKINKLSYKNKLLLQDRYELNDFRNLYNLDQTYADFPKVAARVISNNSNSWFSSFMIDKGSRDGIKVGMNVLSGNGLVGIITKTGYNNATVRSIIDDNSHVSGMFLDTSDNCIVKGNLKLLDEGHIEVIDIKKGVTIKEGYEVVTSYLSPQYHPGILIGYIGKVNSDPSNMTASGTLTPAVDFSKLDMVLIITREKEVLY